MWRLSDKDKSSHYDTILDYDEQTVGQINRHLLTRNTSFMYSITSVKTTPYKTRTINEFRT